MKAASNQEILSPPCVPCAVQHTHSERHEEKQESGRYLDILAKIKARQATTLALERPFEDENSEDDNFKPKWEAIGAELLKDGVVVTDLEFSEGCWGFRDLFHYLAQHPQNTTNSTICRVSLHNIAEFVSPSKHRHRILTPTAFPALETLEVSELGAHSLVPFLKTMQTSSTIRVLSFDGLHLAESEPNFVALGTFLKTSTSIREIRLDSLSCDAEDNKEKWQEAVEELAAGIRASSSLETLNLGMLEVNEAQKATLEAAMKDHATLKTVEAELVTDPEAYIADLKQQIIENGAPAEFVAHFGA